MNLKIIRVLYTNASYASATQPPRIDAVKRDVETYTFNNFNEQTICSSRSTQITHSITTEEEFWLMFEIPIRCSCPTLIMSEPRFRM